MLARPDDEISDEECLTTLVGLAGRALGVGTRADLADYHRLTGAHLRGDAIQVEQLSPPELRIGAVEAAYCRQVAAQRCQDLAQPHHVTARRRQQRAWSCSSGFLSIWCE